MKKVITGTAKTVVVDHAQANTVFVFTGDLGTGTAKLVFSDGVGGTVDIEDGEITVPSTLNLLHGSGNLPVVVSDNVTNLVVVSHGG